ncbi:HEPN/Toprim-associated domain-containing protein [Paraburkholderia agricolaris]|uniref:HEPN/Toprim-associated domain-containing protein n=1 Tax=Paraburkholderia agricolaris TaxID=2152888 RepID=A0ABW8ZWP2_9BURK
MSFAHISIGQKSFSEMESGFSHWYFEQHDRVIWDPGLGEHEIRYLYLTTAAELRLRLRRAGFTRDSLELEFRDYKDKAAHFTNLQYLSDTPEEAHRRAHSVRYATLDDWLCALASLQNFIAMQFTAARFHEYIASDPLIDVEMLTQGVRLSRHIDKTRDALPRHNQIGFPCASLECLAMAMLEVVEDDAPCTLDVTDFVDRGVTTFDDVTRREGREWFPVEDEPATEGGGRCAAASPAGRSSARRPLR